MPNNLSVFIILNITDVTNTHSSYCNVYKMRSFPLTHLIRGESKEREG